MQCATSPSVLRIGACALALLPLACSDNAGSESTTTTAPTTGQPTTAPTTGDDTGPTPTTSVGPVSSTSTTTETTADTGTTTGTTGTETTATTTPGDPSTSTGTTGALACACSGDLQSIVDCEGVVLETCPGDQGCSPDFTCVPACEAADLAKSTVGCEYYTQPTVGYCFAAYIANTWSAPVGITVENNGVQLDIAKYARVPTGNGQELTYAPLPNGELPPDEVAIVFLGGFSCPAGIDAPPAPNGTFRITTTAPVVAYDIDPYGGGSSAITSASLLVPTSAWDTNYVAVAPWPYGENSQPPRLTIIAAEDATEVTISPSAAIAEGKLDGLPVVGTGQGVPVTYMMNRGQSLVFEQEAELTGSPILSTKPIGVIGGSGCINIDACCCDGAHQQIPPVAALGSEYVAVRYRNRVEGQEESPPWRIVGAVDGTTLTYDPAPPPGAPLTLNSGQIAAFRSPGQFIVRSQDAEHPFYFSGYMTGGGDFDGAGDPEFVNVIPAAQYLADYVFFADPTYPETNLVIVRSRAKDRTFKDVVLDCAGPIGGFAPVGESGEYEFARFDLVRFNFEKQQNCDNGRREMHSDAPFGLTVWGWGTNATQSGFPSQYVSYAYPAGASVLPINEVVVLPEPG